MKTAAPLPSLFGRFTAILKQHDHLGDTFGRLRAMCTELEAGQVSAGTSPSPVALLSELRADMAGHFAAEEGRDYFGTVGDEAPQLAPQIADLKLEHGAMLAMVDALLLLAADARQLRNVPAPARALITTLERHERSEAVLLRELFKGGE